MADQITSWVTAVGNEFGIELGRYTQTLLDNGISTQALLPLISEQEWKELIKEVGPRTVLRKAASELSVAADNDVLETVQRARDEKDRMTEQLEQAKEMNNRYQEQLERVQGSVTGKMGAILDISQKRDNAKFDAEASKVKLDSTKSEVKTLTGQRDELKKQLTTAEAARDAAVEQAKALSTYASAMPGR